MAPHHTKDKGDLAVAKVAADLIERGATVLLPMTEHAPYDLVACLDRRFLRIQVKYRQAVNGRLYVSFRSVWSDRAGVHVRPMPRDEVDLVAIYCPQTEGCYFVDPAQQGGSVTIRIAPSKNGQRRGVHPADRFVQLPDGARGVAPG